MSKSFEARSNIDDILAQSMGRDPNMMTINIGQTIVAANKYLKSKAKRNITVNNIIVTENDWNILAALWEKKPSTLIEIYEDKSVKKSNTVTSLKESLNNLEENGLVIEIEEYDNDRFLPAFTPDEMIDIVNRLLAGYLTNLHKEKLSSFISFIILNS